nr:MAG TPA: hypothetical protein [Caudoviricetes sp.]
MSTVTLRLFRPCEKKPKCRSSIRSTNLLQK